MKTKASEHKGLNNVSSVITSVNDMSSSKSAWYANRYARYRDNYEKAFFAHSNNAFFREAGKAVKCFLYAFIYYSFDKDYLVDEIIKGKTLFPPYSSSLKKPSAEDLLILAYASPRHYLIDAIPDEAFFVLVRELAYPKLIENERIPIIRSLLYRISKLFESFSFESGDINKRLSKALKECRRITEDGYRMANERLRDIFRYVSEAERVMESICTIVQSQRLNDPELSNQLVNQLRTVQVDFASAASKAEEDINEKRQTTDNYNITLFGRTSVGKSTLMEILTDGDGDSIGKGGQRTTIDVRQYNWNGLSITDVPGIDAYDGQVDEVLAERASRFADQIIFMITSGQPESIEAKWLVKLKRKDKPIICVCNVKRTVASDKYLQKFLDNPGDVLDKERVSEAIQQFREFVNQELPNEDIPFIITHLQSRYIANTVKEVSKKKALINASRFEDVEKAILCDVINYGKMYRKHCYISILDIPVFEQMTVLFGFSGQNFQNLVLYEEKQRSFKSWQIMFVKDEIERLNNNITVIFDRIERYVATFVDEYAEAKDFGERWNHYIEQQQLENIIGSLIMESYNKAKLHIERVFKELYEEVNLSQFLFYRQSFKGGKIIDWSKGFGWTSEGLGVLAAILVFFPPLQPIAIGLGIVSMLTVGLSWIWKSREKRLRAFKEKKEEELRSGIRNQKELMLKAMEREYEKTIQNCLIKAANERFAIMMKSLKTLAWSQRSFGYFYLRNHLELTETLMNDVLNSIGYKNITLFNVARVPGKRTVLISNSDILNDDEIKNRISNRLGSKEEIVTIKLQGPLMFSIESFNYISEQLGSSLSSPKYSYDTYLENEYLILTFNPLRETTDEEENISILEQLFYTHIVFKTDKYE